MIMLWLIVSTILHSKRNILNFFLQIIIENRPSIGIAYVKRHPHKSVSYLTFKKKVLRIGIDIIIIYE